MKHKLLSLDQCEVKFSADGNAHTFKGYASVFNGLDAYGDLIEPGAYKNTLADRARPIRMRWNHFGPVIGKYTLIEEDEIGLRVEGELTPNHSVADDVAASMKHGAVSGLSIGYRVVSEEMRGDARVLKEIDLVEISVVEEPADNMAQVSGFKSEINSADSLKEIETLLRDAGGFSRKDAASLVGRVRMLSQSDSDATETSEVNGLFKGLYSSIKEG